jgi:hypothetical protein
MLSHVCENGFPEETISNTYMNALNRRETNECVGSDDTQTTYDARKGWGSYEAHLQSTA